MHQTGREFPEKGTYSNIAERPYHLLWLCEPIRGDGKCGLTQYLTSNTFPSPPLLTSAFANRLGCQSGHPLF